MCLARSTSSERNGPNAGHTHKLVSHGSQLRITEHATTIRRLVRLDPEVAGRSAVSHTSGEE